MIVNEDTYPWLAPLPTAKNDSSGSKWFLPEDVRKAAKSELESHGAVSFPDFLTPSAVESAVRELSLLEDGAFTTNTKHTPYLKDRDILKHPPDSIYNHETPTIVASTAFDELAEDSVLKRLYGDPRLLELVASIVSKKLYLSEDPLGCCSVNVFREGYYHGFHYDESEFSVTLMLQEAREGGLFQYTDPIRQPRVGMACLSLELERTADAFEAYEFGANGSTDDDDGTKTSKTKIFSEHKEGTNGDATSPPRLHTLDFRPGTLLVLAGSKSLHRVTKIKGDRSRLVAVLTFASKPGFCNTPKVQEMFWGRSSGQ